MVALAVDFKSMRIDVFCRVVDNFGDAGVMWRLARQLAAEHGAEVVLRIDLPRALERIAADGTPAPGPGSVEIRPLRDDEPAVPLPSLVIEGFGCGLPAQYLAAMAASRRPPVWINLEYLSAEPWIESAHGLPSPHPRLPLVRHFFFPGFTHATGGLLRERDLLAERAGARDGGSPSPLASMLRASVEKARGGSAPVTTVSLFCYANPALPALLDTWAEGDAPVLCIVPEGVAAASFDAWLAGAVPHAGETFTRGALTLATIPFMSQPGYDRLLWACDFDFVRGEDSFVRAQWGAQPFVWHIYPQADDAHRVKLEAFLDRYLADAPRDLVAPTRAFWRAWNDGDGARAAAGWPAFAGSAPALAAHNARWAEHLATLPDLASALVEFCRNRL